MLRLITILAVSVLLASCSNPVQVVDNYQDTVVTVMIHYGVSQEGLVTESRVAHYDSVNLVVIPKFTVESSGGKDCFGGYFEMPKWMQDGTYNTYQTIPGIAVINNGESVDQDCYIDFRKGHEFYIYKKDGSNFSGVVGLSREITIQYIK